MKGNCQMQQTMDEVLECLVLKNHYYEKFYELTLKFLRVANKNQWDETASFVEDRERILSIIRSFDLKMGKLNPKLMNSTVSVDLYQEQVRKLMQVRNNWVTKIVALDLEIISKMDEIKSETIRELKAVTDSEESLKDFSVSSSKRSVKPHKTV